MFRWREGKLFWMNGQKAVSRLGKCIKLMVTTNYIHAKFAKLQNLDWPGKKHTTLLTSSYGHAPSKVTITFCTCFSVIHFMVTRKVTIVFCSYFYYFSFINFQVQNWWGSYLNEPPQNMSPNVQGYNYQDYEEIWCSLIQIPRELLEGHAPKFLPRTWLATRWWSKSVSYWLPHNKSGCLQIVWILTIKHKTRELPHARFPWLQAAYF